jgi:hypothetical protein
MVDALRELLAGQGHFSLEKDLAVIIVTLLVSIAFAINRFDRIEM